MRWFNKERPKDCKQGSDGSDLHFNKTTVWLRVAGTEPGDCGDRPGKSWEGLTWCRAGGGAAARENRSAVIPSSSSLTSEGGEVHALQQSRTSRGNGRGSQLNQKRLWG